MRDLGFPLAASNFDPPKKSKGALNSGAPKSTTPPVPGLKNPVNTYKGGGKTPIFDKPFNAYKGGGKTPIFQTLPHKKYKKTVRNIKPSMK